LSVDLCVHVDDLVAASPVASFAHAPHVYTWAPPNLFYPAVHGAEISIDTHVGEDTSSMQETATLAPATPSAVPSVIQLRSPLSGYMNKSGPFTEVASVHLLSTCSGNSPNTIFSYNERGSVLLVCPCGDTFSLQRGAVERHYDEKHAVEGRCPWHIRGCTASVKARRCYLLLIRVELTRSALRTSRHISATSIALRASPAPCA
jgi:hypothetical protein